MPEIAALLAGGALAGRTLPRTETEVRVAIRQFVTATNDGRVIGCAALEPVAAGVGEIRSVAVDPDSAGMGIGRAIIDALLRRAESLEIERVMLLTREPAFFSKLGFQPCRPTGLPRPWVVATIGPEGRTLDGRTVMTRSVRTAATE